MRRKIKEISILLLIAMLVQGCTSQSEKLNIPYSVRSKMSVVINREYIEK